MTQRRPLDAAVGGGDEVRPGASLDTLPCSQTLPGERAFTVELRCEEHATRLAAVGEFDGAALAPFEEAVTEAIDHARPIRLDLSGLRFIDSSGLWAVTLTQRICRTRGIGLTIAPGPQSVQSVFEVTGLADLLPFVPASATTEVPVHGTP